MEITKIHISESLGGRLDPNQFHSERMDMIHRICSSGRCCKLKEVVDNVKTITTSLTNEDIYIGLENIVSNTGEYISTSDKDSISSAAVFRTGDILFPKLRPYLNKVYRAEFTGKCSTEFHVFAAKDIDADFLTIMLRSNMIVAQTKHLMTGNTLPRLQTSDIENLIIPLPPVEIQQEIVALYIKARTEKQTKEAQVKAFLYGIDSYLLSELGIPPSPEAKMAFKVKFSDILSCRNDPQFFNPRFMYVINYIKSVKHKSLNEIVKMSNETWNQKDYFKETFPYIEISAICTESGDVLEISEIEKSKAPSRAKKIVRNNDILISTTRPNRGAITKIQADNIQIASTGFAIIRDISNEILRDYLLIALRAKFSLEQMLQRSSGGNYPAITEEELRKVIIPLPSIEKQNEIVEHILQIRVKVKQLQQEVVATLESAKSQIEKIILG